jgi:hypothetical protein
VLIEQIDRATVGEGRHRPPGDGAQGILVVFHGGKRCTGLGQEERLLLGAAAGGVETVEEDRADQDHGREHGHRGDKIE